ncbi:MAG: PAS domain S-box protein, partial [Acidobacteriota bacterium]
MTPVDPGDPPTDSPSRSPAESAPDAIPVGTLERQEAASALRHERDRAQRCLDTANVILLALDLDARITLVNRKGCDLLEWTEPELLGRDWIETCVPASVRGATRTRLAAAIGGDLRDSENLILTKSGVERLIEWRHTLLRDDSGKVTGTLSSGDDVTRRRQAEEAQRSSEARYRTLFDHAPDGLLIADHGGRYIDANPSVCRMLGYSLQELIGLHASDIVLASEVVHIAPALQTITATGDYHREWKFRRKDGSVFSADVIVTVMSDGNLLAMIRDLSERNRAIEALQESEERKRYALKHANVGIWDMDFVTGVLRWSETSEAHYGLKPGTFGGTFEEFVGLIHPDDRQSILKTISEATAAGRDFVIEHRVLWPDGTTRWLSGAGRTLIGEQGQPLRAVGITQDITERKQADAELIRLNDDMQRQR